MSDYIAELKKDGYISLMTQYYREQAAAFPALRPSPNTDVNDANAINDMDQRTDKDGDEEDMEDSTDKTLEEDAQIQVKETPKDSQKDPKDSAQDGSDEKQPTPDDSTNDETNPDEQEPPPKKHLETLLATKVTPPIDNPPNKYLIPAPLLLQPTAKSKLPEPPLTPKTPPKTGEELCTPRYQGWTDHLH